MPRVCLQKLLMGNEGREVCVCMEEAPALIARCVWGGTEGTDELLEASTLHILVLLQYANKHHHNNDSNVEKEAQDESTVFRHLVVDT